MYVKLDKQAMLPLYYSSIRRQREGFAKRTPDRNRNTFSMTFSHCNEIPC